MRCLTFVDPKGREERQSAIDMKNPHAMQLGYTSSFFASLLFREPQERVLIVGLGGGGMVRFLNHAFPQTLVEAVEIDRVVVDVAKDYFGTKEGPMTKIHVADAFDYLKETHGPFDALYMDAFLQPSVDSGLERHPATEDDRFCEKPAQSNQIGWHRRFQSTRTRFLYPGGS